MLNRIVLSLASIGTCIVLAYAHLLQWWQTKDRISPKDYPEVDNVHFFTTEMVLSQTGLFGFGALFLVTGVLAAVFSILGKWKGVFLCFVAAMILIWIRIAVGMR
nr:hypothetical protein [Cytophagales bacterium]